MKPEYKKQLLWSARFRKAIQKQFTAWKKHPPADLDDLFHEQHEEAFQQVNCLECAHCCKTTSPIFKASDIQRIAKSFRIKESAFCQEHLQRDEEGDWVLKTAPCTFLDLDTNACRIYDIRPEACREFPHTNRKNMRQILGITEQNVHLCPAVSRMMERMMERLTPP